MSGNPHEPLTKIFRAIPERSRNRLEKKVGKDFVKLGDGNISEIHKKKASGTMSNDFSTTDERKETHQMMMEIEPLLIASGYRTRRNILLTHGGTHATAWCRRFGIPREQT